LQPSLRPSKYRFPWFGVLPAESSAPSPRYLPVLHNGIPLASFGPYRLASGRRRAFRGSGWNPSDPRLSSLEAFRPSPSGSARFGKARRVTRTCRRLVMRTSWRTRPGGRKATPVTRTVDALPPEARAIPAWGSSRSASIQAEAIPGAAHQSNSAGRNPSEGVQELLHGHVRLPEDRP